MSHTMLVLLFLCTVSMTLFGEKCLQRGFTIYLNNWYFKIVCMVKSSFGLCLLLLF